MSKLLLLPGERLSSVTSRNGGRVGGWGDGVSAVAGSGKEVAKRPTPLIANARTQIKNFPQALVINSQKATHFHRHTARAQQKSSSSLPPTVCESGKTACDSGKAARDSGKAARDSGNAMCDSGKAMCDSGKAMCDSGKAVCDSGKAVCDSGKAICNSGKAICNSGKAICNSWKTICNSGKATCVVRAMSGVSSFIFVLPLKDLRDLKDTRDSRNRAPVTVPYVL